MGSRLLMKIATLSLLVLVAVAACQGNTRTEFLMEVTREVTVIVVVTASPGSVETMPPSATPTPEVVAEATAEVSPGAMPAPIVEEIIVAEQAFERGHMFYLQPIGEIWVLLEQEAGDAAGVWERYEDTWQEGEPELDQNLTPPEGLAQPIRGFGKVWRENEGLQNALGWALDAETGHVTIYRYEFGGEVVNGEYVPGPGIHLVNSREPGITYIFDESNSRWSIAADPTANQP